MPSARADSTEVADRAIALVARWASEAADAPVDAAAARLAAVLRDEHGLEFVLGVVDGVLRPESLGAAASRLHAIAPLVPAALPWHLARAVRVGGAVAPVLPSPVVPIARRAVRELVGHLVVDARPDKLGPAIARLRAGGARLTLVPLGDGVLGDAEAARRLAGVHELVRRADVDHVALAVSAIAARPSPWAFDDTVDRLVAQLRPLYLDAAANGTLLTFDTAEYRDLDLTIAVFTRLLEDPRLHEAEAGISLPADLPDALPALRQLTAWARQRVAGGGARIRVRLVAGAYAAAERVDAVMHDWALATYADALDTDANHLRLLDEALRPEAVAAVRVGVATHDPFTLAHAWLLAGERGVQASLEVEMPLGTAEPRVAAVAREVGVVRLSAPLVRPDEVEVATGLLARRLDEIASHERAFAAASGPADDTAPSARAQERYLAALARAADTGLAVGPNRRQDRTAPSGAAPAITRAPAGGESGEAGLTQAVLGIARDAADQALDGRQVLFGGQAFVETAVFSPRESAGAEGAPGFRNTPDSDPALPANREWARDVLDRVRGSRLGEGGEAAAPVADPSTLDAVLGGVRTAAASWAARSASDRAGVLREAARALEARRGRLIEVAASETGKVFAEADVEVSEAVDLAAYYAATAGELDRVAGAVFTPARLTVVAAPWNFPVAIPAGGVLAALATGSGVVLTPAPEARRTAAVLVEALRHAGVPREVLVLADVGEGERGLIEHPLVDRVILTGTYETARRYRSWRADLPLLAETGGKNAIVVAPSADLDLAASDLVRSAFGHAGQKRSAASLAILVGPVARSRRFAQQLVDATTSLRVGPASDPLSEVGPLIAPPEGALRWALTTLGEGERWLVRPRELDFGDADAGRFWTPGIRTGVRPGSRMHLEAFFGPVLGILHANSLAHAIDLQNGVDSGLAAGLHTRDPDDLALWLERVEAGNLAVNRAITGAIVQRQPFGGGKRSSVGGGAKAGGPNHLIAWGSWRASSGGPASSTLHLRGLDSRMTALIEAAQPTLDFEAFEWLRRGALSDAIAWDREFGRVKDVSQLRVERNLLRYRPVDVAVRASADAPWQAVLRVVLAGVRSGSALTLSTPVGLPAEVRRALGDVGVPVSVETDAQWLERLAGQSPRFGAPHPATAGEAPASRPSRVRIVGAPSSSATLRVALAQALDGDPDVAIFADEVTTAGRIELLTFLCEQSISITAHRYGRPDPWSDAVI